LSCLTLTGCGLMINKNDAVDVAKGAAALAETDAIYAQIAEYVGNDSETEQALSEPTEFFKRGWDLIHGDSDKSPYEILEGQPEYVADIESQWAAGVAALDGHAQRSGKPIPDNVVAWMSNLEAGWNQAKRAEAVQEKLNKVGEMLKLARPFARMAGLPV